MARPRITDEPYGPFLGNALRRCVQGSVSLGAPMRARRAPCPLSTRIMPLENARLVGMLPLRSVLRRGGGVAAASGLLFYEWAEIKIYLAESEPSLRRTSC